MRKQHIQTVYIQLSHFLLARKSLKLEDLLDLVDRVVAGQERPGGEYFVDEAAQTPHIGLVRVLGAAEEHLRSPVPACGYELGHVGLLAVVGAHGAGQPKVAYFYLAGRVDEDVGRLQVAVQDAAAVQVHQGIGKLVDDVLFVRFVQNAVLDGIEKVALQVFKHQVQVDVVLGSYDLLELDYIGVIELPQHADFAVGALRIGVILEGQEYLLEGVEFLGFPLPDLPDVPVGPTADLLYFLVFFVDVIGDTILLVFHSSHFEIIWDLFMENNPKYCQTPPFALLQLFNAFTSSFYIIIKSISQVQTQYNLLPRLDNLSNLATDS